MSTTITNSNVFVKFPSKTTRPNEKKTLKPTITKKSYIQASKANILLNIEDIIRVKKVFSTLSVDKVGKMLKAKNSSGGTKKSKINMMTRG